MDKGIKNSLSSLCLVSLFFVGNAVINLPFGYGCNAALLGFITAFLLCLPLILLFSKTSLKKEKAPLSVAFSLIFVLYSLFCGIVTFRNYVTFSDRIILPEIGSFFPTLLFLFLLWLICKGKKEAVLKLALISAILVFSLVIILCLLSLDSMSLTALLPKNPPSLKETGYQTLSFVSMSFIEGVVLMGFINSENKKAIMKGYFTGAAILLIILLQCISVFGYSLTARLDYPYAFAMSIITFGDKFSRMEGFSYLLYFSCTLIKTAVCLISARDSLTLLFPKTKKFFFPAALFIYGIISVFTNIFVNLPFIYIAPFLIVPPVILVIYYCIPLRCSTKSKGPRFP